MKIKIRVIPKASRNKLEKLEDDSYKAYLTVPPIDGKANDALIRLLSKEFHIAKTSIKIVRGEKSRNKVIEIPD